MKTKLIVSLATTAVAAAFAVTLFAAPPAGSDRQGPPRGPDRQQGDAERPQARGHGNMQRGGGARLDRLFERLDLTDDQVAAIRAERDDRAGDIQALRDEIVDAQRKLRALGEEMREAVASHLTDEQKEALAARGEGRRDRGQRRGRGGERPERRGGPDRGPGPGQGPPADAE